MSQLRDYLWKYKEKELKILGIGSLEFLEKTTPDRLRKWNLLGRFFEDDFLKVRDLYDCSDCDWR